MIGRGQAPQGAENASLANNTVPGTISHDGGIQLDALINDPNLMDCHADNHGSNNKYPIISQLRRLALLKKRNQIRRRKMLDRMIKIAFRQKSQVHIHDTQIQIRNMVDHIIIRSSLSSSWKYMANYPYSRSQESMDNIYHKVTITRFTLDHQWMAEKVIVLTILDSNVLKGKVQILIQNVNAQVILFSDGSQVENLPGRIIDLLKHTSSLLIVENRSSKNLENLERLPNIFTQEIPLIWVEGRQVLEKLQQLRNEIIICGTYNLETGFIKSYKYFVSEGSKDLLHKHRFYDIINRLKHVRDSVQRAFEKDYPLAKDSRFSFLPSIVQNIELNKRGDANLCTFPQQMQIYWNLVNLVDRLVTRFKLATSRSIDVNRHHPQMLTYPKYCVCCKKNNTIFKLEAVKTNKKKTKYTCPACNQIFRTEVRLCVMCFRKFHLNLSEYMDDASIGDKPVSFPFTLMRQDSLESDEEIEDMYLEEDFQDSDQSSDDEEMEKLMAVEQDMKSLIQKQTNL